MPRGAGGEPRGLSEPTGGVLKKAEVTNKENQKLWAGFSDTEVDGIWGGGAEARSK